MANDDEIFRTTRMAHLRGTNPSFIPGEVVFLQRDVQGFAKGSQAKIVSVQAARPGEHRYLLLVGDEKFWPTRLTSAPLPRVTRR